MREIKYRAVIKAGRLKGKILPVVRIEWESYSNGEVKALNNIWCDPGGDKLDIPYLPKDVNLLEFTGLKDVNGKDIYEGDILKYFLGQHESWIDVGFVEFGKNREWPEVHVISRRDMEGVVVYYPNVKDMKMEIIGNIYENPELLEVSE